MRTVILCCILALAPAALALTPNLPAGTLGPDLVVQTRLGPMPNCIVYAPRPVVVPLTERTRGVYAVDISVATGYVYSARVLESSRDTGLDNAALDTLRKWRFRPRSIYKLIVPIGFSRAGARLGANR